MSKYHVEALANEHCVCGENPMWEPGRKLVYWTDIESGRLFRYDTTSQKWEQFYEGPRVGGFTVQADGSLLLFRENEFAVMDADGNVKSLVADIDSGMDRFNDVTTDPEGRVFAGTCSSDKTSAGVYRIDLDGTVTRLFTGTACSNGMGFSPDLAKYYWTDTSNAKIFEFDYDRATGEIGNRRVFLDGTDRAGFVDGMAVDIEGNIWSARWDGFALHRYSPTGQYIETIDFPVGQVSSVGFGGDDLRDLYVTTAGGAPGSTSDDGTLYRVRGVEVPGMPEFRSRVLL